MTGLGWPQDVTLRSTGNISVSKKPILLHIDLSSCPNLDQICYQNLQHWYTTCTGDTFESYQQFKLFFMGLLGAALGKDAMSGVIADIDANQDTTILDDDSDIDIGMACEPSALQPTITEPNVWDNPNYTWIKGDRNNGVVVVYPQFHLLGVDIHSPTNQAAYPFVVQCQLEILMDLLAQRAEHLYCEGNTVESIQAFNEIADNHPHLVYFFATIMLAILTRYPLNDAQKEILAATGAANIYAILSRAGFTERKAILHPVTSEDVNKKVREAWFVDLSDADRRFLFDDRESEVEQAINATQHERGGKPAYVVMGAFHTFDNAFSEPNSPALYRREERRSVTAKPTVPTPSNRIWFIDGDDLDMQRSAHPSNTNSVNPWINVSSNTSQSTSNNYGGEEAVETPQEPMPTIHIPGPNTLLSLEALHDVLNQACATNVLDQINLHAVNKPQDLPLEVRKNLPLAVDASNEYLEFVIASKLEYLAQFTCAYNNEQSFTESNIRTHTKERGQCFLEVIKFCQSQTCPLSQEAKTRFCKALIDFSYTRSLFFIDICREDLSGLDLSGLHLQYTHCDGTNFANTKITWTDFSHASCVGAVFANTEGKYPYFVSANLSNADFSSASIAHGTFRTGKYEDPTILFKTNFQNAVLLKPNFEGSDLSTVNFTNAKQR